MWTCDRDLSVETGDQETSSDSLLLSLMTLDSQNTDKPPSLKRFYNPNGKGSLLNQDCHLHLHLLRFPPVRSVSGSPVN